MDSLPNTSSSQGDSTTPAAGAPLATGSMAKEVAPLPSVTAETPTRTEIGKEDELSAEVTKAGVRMSTETIELPKLVQQMGVTSVSPQAQAAVVPAITLPLSDEQIANGLHQSIMTSWRWLSEWCKRQLQQAHLTLKSLGGKTVRTQE